MHKSRIVIVGGGFGGVYTAKRLARFGHQFEITLINRTNYFLFTPLLHEVATGGLSPTSVTEPLREIFAGTNVQVHQGEVTRIDRAERVVYVGASVFPYDYLVLASGSATNYYSIPGAREHAFGLKTLHDAVAIRDRSIDLFEQASLMQNSAERARLLSFVVVGGGATGVEVAAELAEFVYGIKRRYYRELGECRELSVALVHGGAELLEHFHPTVRKRAHAVLTKKRVIIRYNTTVSSVQQRTAHLSDGSVLDAGMVVWAAGVIPVVPSIHAPVERSRDRVELDAFLRVDGDRRIFGLGDVAAHHSNTPFLAQAAVQEASVVADNIRASAFDEPLRPFSFHSKGQLISLGQWQAAGVVYGIPISGRFTWWLWRTVYLFTFASWRKRIRIAFEWTVNLFYPRDITKLQ